MAKVQIVGVGRSVLGLIRESLGTEAVLPQTSVHYDDAIGAAHHDRPNVVLVGLNDDPEAAVNLGAEYAREFPHATLVAISSGSEPDQIRAAMRAGFREFVVLPDDSDLLRQAVHEAVYSSGEEDEERGEVIAFCGTKGGCGTTSLAINLAAELCPVHQVVAIDLNFSMGDLASMLDLKTKRDISDLLRDVDRLDTRVLKGCVSVHPSKLHVIGQPNETDEHEEIRGDAVLRVLQVAAESYQYCMMDCGVSLDEATLTTMTVADMVFLVATPNVPSIKNAWRRLQLFERIGIDRERVRLVLNKSNKKDFLSRKDIEENLGLRIAAVVHEDNETMADAINHGRLAREVNKRSVVAKDYSNLVSLITDGEEIIETKEKEKGSALSWLFN